MMSKGQELCAAAQAIEVLLRGFRRSCLRCELLDHLICRYLTSDSGSSQFALVGGVGKALRFS